MQRKEEGEGGGLSSGGVYCVTGASGYIGSYLVKSLLEKGCFVHAAVRDLGKCDHLLSCWNGGERLKTFRANLQEEGSFDEAINGCDGVFHAASSMQFNVPTYENIDVDAHVRSNIIEPAIEGTINVLKSCSKSESVKRVILTSSISTISAKDDSGTWRSVVDESCQTPIDRVWKTKASGWVYVLTKLLTEEAAFKYAEQHGLDLVSVITPTIAGPFLTSNVPSSLQVLLSPLTGDYELFQILLAVSTRLGSIALAHIEDICNVHIFLMEQPKPEGRYMCCAKSCSLTELVKILHKIHPCTSLKRNEDEQTILTPPEISCQKLRDLGFQYKHGLEDIIHAAVSSCRDGFLPPLEHSGNTTPISC